MWSVWLEVGGRAGRTEDASRSQGGQVAGQMPTETLRVRLLLGCSWLLGNWSSDESQPPGRRDLGSRLCQQLGRAEGETRAFWHLRD